MPLMTHSEDDQPRRGRETAKKRKRLLEEAPSNAYMRVTGMRDIPLGSRHFLDSVKEPSRPPEARSSPARRDQASLTSVASSRASSWDDRLDAPEPRPYADLFVQPYLSSSGILTRDETPIERQRRPDPAASPVLATKRYGDSPLSDRSGLRRAWSDTSHTVGRTQPTSPDTARDASSPVPAHVVTLDGPRTLPRWTEQTQSMARSLGCYDQLFDNSTVATVDRTEDEWIANNRIGLAYNLVHSRLSPAVFAYMRVLGYSRVMGKSASNIFHFAKLAAGRLDLVTSGQQRDEEVRRMYEEWAKMPTDTKEYHGHNPAFVKDAQAWLHKMLVHRAERGDAVVERLLESAYQSHRDARVKPAASSHDNVLSLRLTKDDVDGLGRKRQRLISPASSLDLKTDPEGRTIP